MKKIITICSLVSVVFLGACKKETEDIAPDIVQLRTKIEYSKLDTASYAKNFLNAAGDSTVDRSIGRNYNMLFLGLNAYIRTSVDSTKALSLSTLKNIYTNSNSPYTGIYTSLNSSGLQIKNKVGSSFTQIEAAEIQADIEMFMEKLAKSSDSVAKIASNGVAGRIVDPNRKYLVDEKGIEWGQVVQKALIGTYQIDYIGNVLLSGAGNNASLVEGKNYTQLEQNWDRAYGLLTQKNVYGSAALDNTSGENLLGAYAWEYNPYKPKNKKALYDIHYAFLRGRAAIVNNDAYEFKIQSDKIRLTFEKAVASAALGYLGKWKTLSSDAEKAHALAEGLGFIYALRVCKLSGADAAFSDEIFDDLIASGHWGLTLSQVISAESKIKSKFGL